jgi:hypothetical protein
MIEPEDKIVGLGKKSALEHAQHADELPYSVLLCHSETGTPERVLARAASAQLARAIFNAAQSEFSGRRIMLRRGGETVLDLQR